MGTSRLMDGLATTDALEKAFSDRAVLRAMLEFEVALARAAAKAGVIPARAAEAIAGACVERLDADRIAREARRSATPSIPFVEALREEVRARDPESATFVHWAATSQDLSDSALMLVLARARPAIASDHGRLAPALRQLSDAHAGTVMLGRTLLQPATPITFGLKVAGWRAAIVRAWGRLADAWDRALMIQFGGATGTRAAAGAAGDAIMKSMAADLGLAAAAPWHTDRDRLGALIAACGLYTASLGKMARDIALLMQAEVGEVAEPGGGSSTMLHKRNPAGCTRAIAAATRMPALVAGFLSGMPQEHERSAGGSQAEWPTIAAAVQATGAAAESMADVIGGLSVDPARMRANLEAMRGTIFAERAEMLLSPTVGRETARALVERALRQCTADGTSFADALAALPEASSALSPHALGDLDDPERYLGDAEAIRRELLEE